MKESFNLKNSPKLLKEKYRFQAELVSFQAELVNFPTPFETILMIMPMLNFYILSVGNFNSSKQV